LHYDLSCKVLEAAFKVHNALGPCLLEAVYEGAFCVELSRMGIPFERQQVFPVEYCGEYVGTYFADVVVDNALIVELKSAKSLTKIMAAQIVNYLKLSNLHVGYLLNFHGIRAEWKRFVNSGSG
jgi:GxxExxY protein